MILRYYNIASRSDTALPELYNAFACNHLRENQSE